MLTKWKIPVRPAVVLALLAVAVGCGESEEGDSGQTSVNVTLPDVTVETTALPRADAIIDYEEPPYESISDMAEAADSVVVARVEAIESLGRPHLEEDPESDEYVGVDLRVEETISGKPLEAATLVWSAYSVNSEGVREAEIYQNGVRPPQLQDRMLLFLIDAPDDWSARFDGVPTHVQIRLDGVAYLDDAGEVTEFGESNVADELAELTIDALKERIDQ